MARESARKFGEPSLNGIIRRVVGLPRKIIGEFSRVVDHEIDVIKNIGRSRNNQNLSPPFPLQPAPLESLQTQEQWVFLATFEQQYGSFHPFFYVCSFGSALKIANDENKFMFMYLHDPLDQHSFTSSFCTDTLCSELVVEFLDVNFVSWGGLVNRGDGMKMAATFRPASFPFCALIAPTDLDNDLAVLQQIEGPISAIELVEILQRAVEEQGSAFGVSSKTYNRESDRSKADRHLREDQDVAYIAALSIDEEKEKLVTSRRKKYQDKGKETCPNTMITKPAEQIETPSYKTDDMQVLIRFPNGERKEQTFSSRDKMQVIFGYIDSLGIAGIGGNYRLISNFPKRVYGVEQLEMTLKDVGMHPGTASLFLEFL